MQTCRLLDLMAPKSNGKGNGVSSRDAASCFVISMQELLYDRFNAKFSF